MCDRLSSKEMARWTRENPGDLVPYGVQERKDQCLDQDLTPLYPDIKPGNKAKPKSSGTRAATPTPVRSPRAPYMYSDFIREEESLATSAREPHARINGKRATNKDYLRGGGWGRRLGWGF